MNDEKFVGTFRTTIAGWENMDFRLYVDGVGYYTLKFGVHNHTVDYWAHLPTPSTIDGAISKFIAWFDPCNC